MTKANKNKEKNTVTVLLDLCNYLNKNNTYESVKATRAELEKYIEKLVTMYFKCISMDAEWFMHESELFGPKHIIFSINLRDFHFGTLYTDYVEYARNNGTGGTDDPLYIAAVNERILLLTSEDRNIKSSSIDSITFEFRNFKYNLGSFGFYPELEYSNDGSKRYSIKIKYSYDADKDNDDLAITEYLINFLCEFKKYLKYIYKKYKLRMRDIEKLDESGKEWLNILKEFFK